MFDKIVIGWNDGPKTPADEFKYALERGHHLHTIKYQDEIISKLAKLPKHYEGFIEDSKFYSASSSNRVYATKFANKCDRDICELGFAWNYIMRMQANISMEELLCNKNIDNLLLS